MDEESSGKAEDEFTKSWKLVTWEMVPQTCDLSRTLLIATINRQATSE